MVSETPIHNLDDDSLLQIFSYYRLEDKDNWYLRLGWLKLIHVCRRWRKLISDSWSHLDMCLLITNDSPSIDALSHLPPLPLVIDYSDRARTIARKDEDNIHLGLQQHDRVRHVALQGPSSSLRMWLKPMNKLFPVLQDLSLLSTTTDWKEMSQVVPELLQAPNLRHLSLHGIGLPKGSSLLSPTTALSTLSLTQSCYIPPGHLVARLQGLPHLEELSIGFAIPIPLPSSEGELLSAPTTPVTLPTLRRLTFRGEDVYLENLVAQIKTPLLEQLSLSLLFDLDFTLVNLTKFIHRIEGIGIIGCLVARVIFNKDGISVDTGNYKQSSIGVLGLHINCKPLDWQIGSATQVCTALRRILSTVEELTLDLDVDGMPSDWENRLDSMVWHELLLPFVGVKKLRIGSSLTLQLSQSLESIAGGLVLELLPKLQELEVHLKMFHSKNVFSLFVGTRESVARPVHLSVPPSQQSIWPNKTPFISEDQLKSRLSDITRSKGIRLNELDLVIDGLPIDLWALHRAVVSRDGFESVSTRDEWPVIGAVLGLPFPSVTGGDAGQPPRCGSVIAHRLQLLYNDVLRYFDQLYIHTIAAHPHTSRPTEADYQALLTSITEESLIINSESMFLLPRFSHASGADLEAHHVPQHVISFVEQNREQLQHAAHWQSQSAGLTFPPTMDSAQPDDQGMLSMDSILNDGFWDNVLVPGYSNPMERLSEGYGAGGSGSIAPDFGNTPIISRMDSPRRAVPADSVQRRSHAVSGIHSKSALLDKRSQVDHVDPLQTMARPQQFVPGHQQPQALRRQGLVQGPGKPNTLQPGQLFNNVGPLVPPSATQSISTSSTGIPSMGAQITGSNSIGGVPNHGGAMSGTINPAAMKGVTSGSFPAQFANVTQIRRLTQEDLIAAKRLVNEKKIMAFSHAPDFNGIAGCSLIPDSDKQEYYRKMEHLDQVLSNIEKYIHYAFAALKEEVVEKMFKMMASAKFQLEELKKPNPRYVLELHTIRGMIQEAENMDKGLKAVLQRTQAHMTPGGVPFAPPQPPSAITDALVSPPVHPTAPPAPEAVSRPPHPPPLQPAHRKKPSRSQATPTLPPIPFVTPQAASPGITAPSPQTPKSPKGKPKPKPPTRHKGSKSANGPGVETPTAVHTVTPTPTSSTPVDAKGGRKRVRDDGNDAPTPGASSAPSPKRVKTKLGGPPNEET